jgi:hypothetical protein
VLLHQIDNLFGLSNGQLLTGNDNRIIASGDIHAAAGANYPQMLVDRTE